MMTQKTRRPERRLRSQRRQLWVGLVGTAAGCVAVAWSALSSPATQALPATGTLPATESLAATSDDAAPRHWNGFVDDDLCASCHGAIAETYGTHGMARSFASGREASRVETLPSPPIRDGRLTYQVTERDGDLVFAQWQTTQDGDPIHRWERVIDWAVGSATNARVYLAQSADGMLVELPVAWFAQTGEWSAKPGTARSAEAGLRLITRECMFCHTAVPSASSFDDQRFHVDQFPRDLPEGVGCQRCHGPGRDHVLQARAAERTMAEARASGTRPDAAARRALRDAVRSSIVDPSSLDPARRRDVCAQCHHQPSIAVFGIRRLDRSDYEFTAGDALDEFLMKVEVDERLADGTTLVPAHRFEINHHAYRLERSPCFVESPPGGLECTQCHDPHRHLDAAETRRRARSTCTGCHDPASSTSTSADRGVSAEHFARADCVTCHMPRRRTQDIVEVAMTDHRIQRRAAPEAERLAPLEPRLAQTQDVRPLDPGDGGPFDRLEIASGSVALGFFGPVNELQRQIPMVAASHPEADLTEPTLRLAQAHLLQGRLDAARRLLEPLPARADAAQQARVWLSMIAARQNRPQDALRWIEEAVVTAGDPGDGDLFLRRGRLRLWAGQPGACDDIERSVALNDFVAEAWFLAGRCRVGSGRPQDARAAWARSLAIDPDMGRAAAPLVALLRALGDEAEANRVAAHHGLVPAGD